MSAAGALASAAPRACDAQVGRVGTDSITFSPFGGCVPWESATNFSPEDFADKGFRTFVTGTVEDLLGRAALDNLALIEEND